MERNGTPIDTTSAPVRLQPKRARSALIAVLTAALTGAGVLMVRSGQSSGWFVLSVFAFCTVTILLTILPGASWLAIHPDRIEFAALYRRTQIPFQHIEAFYPSPIGPNERVAIRFSREAPASKARQTALRLTGVEGAIPDTYGYSAPDLAQELNAALQRFRAAHR